MITVTRLNGEHLVLNAGLIEFIEAVPETMISLITGRKLAVKESILEVVQRVAEYEQGLCAHTRTQHLQNAIVRNRPQEDEY